MELGLNTEPFKCIFYEPWLHKGDRLIHPNSMQIRIATGLMRILGFKYRYEATVMSEPIPVRDGFEYNVQLKKCELYWLGIKIRTYK